MRVLRNNSDGTFAAQSPFGALSRVRGFAWADLDGEGVPDAALLDDQGVLRVFLNLRGVGVPRTGRARASSHASPQSRSPSVSGDGIVDVLGVAADGTVTRLSTQLNGSSFEAARVARVRSHRQGWRRGPRGCWSRISTTTAPAISSPPGRPAHESLLASPGGSFRQASGDQLPGGITSAADLDGDGRLELVAAAR